MCRREICCLMGHDSNGNDGDDMIRYNLISSSRICTCTCIYIHKHIHKFIYWVNGSNNKYNWIFKITFFVLKPNTISLWLVTTRIGCGTKYDTVFVWLCFLSFHYALFRFLIGADQSNLWRFDQKEREGDALPLIWYSFLSSIRTTYEKCSPSSWVLLQV